MNSYYLPKFTSDTVNQVLDVIYANGERNKDWRLSLTDFNHEAIGVFHHRRTIVTFTNNTTLDWELV